jgi:hypothetical protein
VFVLTIRRLLLEVASVGQPGNVRAKSRMMMEPLNSKCCVLHLQLLEYTLRYCIHGSNAAVRGRSLLHNPSGELTVERGLGIVTFLCVHGKGENLKTKVPRARSP